MKKITLPSLLVCALTIGIAMPASAQLSLPGLGGGSKSSGGDIDSQVKSFTEKSSAINGLVYKSLKFIVAAYASTEEAAKIAEETKAFEAITDPKEKQAKVAEALKSDSAKLEEISKSKDAQEKTKKLDKTKQAQVAASVGNFLIAALRAPDLVKNGQTIVQSVSSNPMNVGKVVSVKDAIPILSDAISTSTKVMPGFMKVLQGANVQVPKVTAESKTEEVKF